MAFTAVYLLPFKGNRFIEGWQLSGIEQYQTGNPLNVTQATSTFTGTTGVVHPNLVAPVQYLKTKVSATGVQWFNPATCTALTAGCIFQFPTAGTYGNLSRNALVGPGFTDTDFSIEKNTAITEGLKFQIRADAFDIFNHANFGNPSLSGNSSSFGLITATRFATGDSGSSRQLQIVGKFIF